MSCWRRTDDSFQRTYATRNWCWQPERERTILALSWLDVAECDGRGWPASDGQDAAFRFAASASWLPAPVPCCWRSPPTFASMAPRSRMICEQASWGSLASFAWHCSAGRQGCPGVQLKRDLAGVPFARTVGRSPLTVKQTVESVTISRAGRSRPSRATIWPAVFIWFRTSNCRCCWDAHSAMASCKSTNFRRTTVSSVFCAGEPTGIGGVELALIEGADRRSCCGGTHYRGEQHCLRKRQQAAPLRGIARSHIPAALGLRSLPLPETIVCRCEDVPYSRLRATQFVARRQTAHALRHGALPGTSLRTRDAIPFQVEPGFGSTTGFPRSRRELGGLAAAVGTATQRSNRRTLMNWKGVMPAITTSFTEDLQCRSRLYGGTLPLAAGQRLRRDCRPGLIRRGRDVVF